MGSGYGNYISMEKWVAHFENLNSKDPAGENQNYNYCNLIKTKVQQTLEERGFEGKCQFLDSNFTIAAIKKIITGLKIGKATGSDTIAMKS